MNHISEILIKYYSNSERLSEHYIMYIVYLKPLPVEQALIQSVIMYLLNNEFAEAGLA